jgi:hypothetical protein
MLRTHEHAHTGSHIYHLATPRHHAAARAGEVERG